MGELAHGGKWSVLSSPTRTKNHRLSSRQARTTIAWRRSIACLIQSIPIILMRY